MHLWNSLAQMTKTDDLCSVPRCFEPACVTLLAATNPSRRVPIELGFCLVHCHEYEAMGYRRPEAVR